MYDFCIILYLASYKQNYKLSIGQNRVWNSIVGLTGTILNNSAAFYVTDKVNRQTQSKLRQEVLDVMVHFNCHFHYASVYNKKIIW